MIEGNWTGILLVLLLTLATWCTSVTATTYVSVFTSEGHFVLPFGEGLGRPEGVAVDDNGVVYVCYERCIRVF